ncbi:MAG: 4'-phosphopantetheinyl transferase superfamily protein [Gammaproteobacteria bacterium]
MVAMEEDLTVTYIPWRFSQDCPVLPFNEIHLWRMDLNHAYKYDLQKLLSVDEITRSERFHFSIDRKHFMVARGLLRLILGRYLNRPPNELQFLYNAYGKPALADQFGGTNLRFNVSHSNGLALYAITTGREVGVDVEYMRPLLPNDRIGEQFFSPREITVLHSLPPQGQQTAFYAGWTRKEAYIKAVGKGLSLDLDQFDVELRPHMPAALLSVKGDPREAARWTLQEVVPAPGYAGAIAAEGDDWQLKCWQWQDESE